MTQQKENKEQAKISSCPRLSRVLDDRLQNGSPYPIGPLSVMSVCDVDVLWPNGWMD